MDIGRRHCIQTISLVNVIANLRPALDKLDLLYGYWHVRQSVNHWQQDVRAFLIALTICIYNTHDRRDALRRIPYILDLGIRASAFPTVYHDWKNIYLFKSQ